MAVLQIHFGSFHARALADASWPAPHPSPGQPCPPLGQPTWKRGWAARTSQFLRRPGLKVRRSWFPLQSCPLSVLPAFLPTPGAEHPKLDCQK